MPVTRTYGRRLRRDISLVIVVLEAETEIAAREDRRIVEVVAHGDSADFQEWISIRVQGASADEEIRLLDALDKCITRHGAVIV